MQVGRTIETLEAVSLYAEFLVQLIHTKHLLNSKVKYFNHFFVFNRNCYRAHSTVINHWVRDFDIISRSFHLYCFNFLHKSDRIDVKATDRYVPLMPAVIPQSVRVSIAKEQCNINPLLSVFHITNHFLSIHFAFLWSTWNTFEFLVDKEIKHGEVLCEERTVNRGRYSADIKKKLKYPFVLEHLKAPGHPHFVRLIYITAQSCCLEIQNGSLTSPDASCALWP